MIGDEEPRTKPCTALTCLRNAGKQRLLWGFEDILELVDDGDEGLHAVDQLSADSANINKIDTAHVQFIQN